ncbi:MAG: molybdenum cofactor cytidylyltransferase [Chloroflexi bacterium]|nr:molybdenum cofactor cytidylyltransferase [Chloroflexota bacterium]
MRVSLYQALNVKANEVISFVGAGGKTTAALRLMEELAGIEQRVLFTTTTKILEPIPKQDEYLFLGGDEEALAQVPELLRHYPKVFLAKRRLEEVDLTAPSTGLRAGLGESDRDYPMRPNKLDGVPPSLVDLLARQLSDVVILVEADGARHCALKAPAAYEPVVPASTTILVPMADLTVLRKPLTEQHVHRPGLVAGLTGAALGQPVTVEMVAAVLSHPQGGLKALPEQARAVPILNQIAEDRPMDEAREIAHLILRNERVERVVIASLRASRRGFAPLIGIGKETIAGVIARSGFCDEAIPNSLAGDCFGKKTPRNDTAVTCFLVAPEPVLEVMINPQSEIGNRKSAVAAIVLAAGESQRFGQPKQLLPVGSKTMIQHVVDVALSSPVEQVIVVLGCRAAEIKASIADRPVQMVVNERWKSGLSSSVQAGLSAVKPQVNAALFVLADQPGVTPQVIARLVERYRQTRAPIVVPTHRGRRGNPVLFGRSLFGELMQVKGDQGGRELIAQHSDHLEEVEVETEAILVDIDTADDYRAANPNTPNKPVLSQSEGFGTPTSNLQYPISNTQYPISKSINSLIIDLDGVVYRGDEAIVGAREFVALLQREGVPFVLLTNNSTRTPGQYVTRLAQMGIAVEEGDILTSAQATALYMERIAPPGARVYAIGEEGLRTALGEKYTITEGEADFVVVGMDRGLTYEKLRAATLLIRSRARFIATNPDKTLPTKEGLVPGNGAIIAALQAATGVAPFVVGKPEPAIFDLALARMGAGKEGAAVIGDRLETDILGGQRAGLITILVLSGATSRQELANSPVKPDLVFDDLRQLYEAWPKS